MKRTCPREYAAERELTHRTDLNPTFNMELVLASSSLDWI